MRDPTDPLALAFDADGEAFEAQVRQSYTTAAGLLRGEPVTAELIASVVHSAQQAVDRQAARMAQETADRHRKRVACADRCAHCCFQHVQATTTELALLAFAIHDQEQALATATAAARRVAGVSREDRYRNAIPCLFLEDRRCSIYDLRPGPCRTHFSLSRLACDQDWRNRLRRKAGAIPMPTGPKAMGGAVMLGLDMATHELGLETELVELTVGVRTILEPGALARWLAGERIFGAVREASPDLVPYSEAVAAALARWGGGAPAAGRAPAGAAGPA